jgi:hypothetical protein
MHCGRPGGWGRLCGRCEPDLGRCLQAALHRVRTGAGTVIPRGLAARWEYLTPLDDTAWGAASDVVPKFVSPSDPAAQWTGAHKRPASFLLRLFGLSCGRGTPSSCPPWGPNSRNFSCVAVRSRSGAASSKCRIWTRSIASFYRNFKRDLQMMHILVSALTICILANSAQTRAQESLVNYKILGSWTCFRSNPSRARRLSETRRQAAIRLLLLTEADIR